MKRTLTLILLLGAALAARAQAAPQDALKAFSGGLDKSYFTGASLAGDGHPVVEATAAYEALPASGREEQAGKALATWRDASGGISALLSVRFGGGGELWLLKKDGPAKLDEWSDSRLPFSRSERRGSDRFFGYVGGQYLHGSGDIDSTTAFNGKLGKTLLGGRYDAALIFGRSKTGDVATTTYGLTGRALFPLGPRLGWNLGASLTRVTASSGDGVTNVAALGGVSLFLPGGSFDVTLAMGNHSVYSLMLGYTIYLSRK
ncbi:MAG: hypothetical protein M0025_08975 [Elusimicrobia bacterium]|nr:hypothetical protein [Elusimicrobiota bacterium]